MNTLDRSILQNNSTLRIYGVSILVCQRFNKSGFRSSSISARRFSIICTTVNLNPTGTCVPENTGTSNYICVVYICVTSTYHNTVLHTTFRCGNLQLRNLARLTNGQFAAFCNVEHTSVSGNGTITFYGKICTCGYIETESMTIIAIGLLLFFVCVRTLQRKSNTFIDSKLFSTSYQKVSSFSCQIKISSNNTAIGAICLQERLQFSTTRDVYCKCHDATKARHKRD